MLAARPDRPPDAAPTAVRRAAALVLVEAAGLAVVAAVVLVKTATGEPSDRTASLLETGMAAGAALLLVLLARSLGRLAGWSRSPVVVLQLLALPVGASLAFQAGLWGYGGPVLALAVGVLYLLATPEARLAFLDR